MHACACKRLFLLLIVLGYSILRCGRPNKKTKDIKIKRKGTRSACAVYQAQIRIPGQYLLLQFNVSKAKHKN
jgi:hypothetical protein